MTNPQKPPRLRAGVVLVALQWLTRFVVPVIAPDAAPFAVMGGVVLGGLAVLVWWTFFSRLPWSERIGGLVLIVAGVIATPLALHPSITTGLMGIMFYLYVVPGLCLALVAWVAVRGNLTGGQRLAGLAAAILVACGVWTLVKSGGFGGALDHDFSWRWSKTPEERLLATDDEPMALAATQAAGTRAEWPGFLGPERNAVIRGSRIETDWEASPPEELWRRPVGPGWSSFAVHGDLIYTQEQRGDDEIVACYKASTGETVWRHSDVTRFWESIGGAGPRGTPTLHEGHVYAFGATGILNVLDATDGSVVWSRNAATDTGAVVPYWGFSGSPLVVDDLVVVAASCGLAAYDLETGDPRWLEPVDGQCYSSPQLSTLGGVTQILVLNGAGVTGVTPSDGAKLWEHPWPGDSIVQPVLTPDGDVLISMSAMSGVRRLTVVNGPDGWSVEERWTSNGLKPYYSEFVVHAGHAFGFTGTILSCIDIADGERKWKGGRYGAGQLLLLADQDLLLVLGEEGDLALVAAAGNGFRELARLPVLDGKTWNHPVLVGNVLLVRNAEEMVAFRLASS